MAVDTLATLTLLDPRVEARPQTTARVPRPADLRGKRVGFLANSKPNADEFLVALGELLRERHALGEVVHLRKPTPSRPAPAPLLDRLAADCDLVVTAVGD
jgi:hypothetical protein